MIIIQLVIDHTNYNTIDSYINTDNIYDNNVVEAKDLNTYTLSDYVNRNIDYNLVTDNYTIVPQEARVGEIFRDMFLLPTPWL